MPKITYLDEEDVAISPKITYLDEDNPQLTPSISYLDEEGDSKQPKITYLDEPAEVIEEVVKPSFEEKFTGLLKAFSSGTLKAAGRIPLPLPQGTEPLKPDEDPDIKMGSFADYLEKVVPAGTLEYEPKDMPERIASGFGGVIQDLGQLATAAKITAPLAPLVTNQILEKAPTIARVVGGLAAQSGATFGVKELVNQMADFYEDKVSAKGVISNTLLSTGFGAGLGAAGSIASPALRIPTEMAYGFMTANIEGADNLDAGITAGIFGLFGLLNRQNLTKVYKQAAINGAQKALSKRLVKEGYEGLEAERFSRQFFQEGIEASGGIETVNIKKVDEAVKKVRAMEITRKPKQEGEALLNAKAEEGLPPEVKPPEPISIPAEQILKETTEGKPVPEEVLKDYPELQKQKPAEVEKKKAIPGESQKLLDQAEKYIKDFDKSKTIRYAEIIAQVEKSKTVEPQHMAEAIQYHGGLDPEISISTLFDYSTKTSPLHERVKELGLEDELADKQFWKSVEHVKSVIADMDESAKKMLRQYISVTGDLTEAATGNKLAVGKSGIKKKIGRAH